LTYIPTISITVEDGNAHDKNHNEDDKIMKLKLRVRTLDLDAAGKTIAIINKEDALDLGVRALERIVLHKKKKKITVIVNITPRFVKPGEIVVYNEVKEILGLKNKDIVFAEPREELVSKKYIRKKVEGGELNYNEMRSIIDDVIERDLNDLEIAAFITALQIRGLSVNENAAMAKAMIDTSKKIKFSGVVVDKHSVGGIPGDKTSMLFVPIVAASGLTIPKTSSRSITSPAGTADRVEILMPVDIGIDKIKKVVNKCNGCLVWGGSVDLAPADDLFIQIEHPLDFDPLLLPSVMSKKKVVDSKYLVIDIPTGPEAKIKTKEDAEKLARDFIELGKKLGIKVDCAITRGDQPLGYAMGPALEAREALENIMNVKHSHDLIDKVTSLAGLLFKMIGKGNKYTAEKLLSSGAAEKKLRQIIEAQGGKADIMPDDIPYAKYKAEIKAPYSGIVAAISNHALVAAAKAAGAPKDKLAGILLNKKIEDVVKKGEVLFTIYAERKQRLKQALKIANADAFSIFDHKKRKMLVEEVKR